MHELTHVLGFSGSLYTSFQNHNLQTYGSNKANVVKTSHKRGGKTLILHTANVKSVGRSYFACHNLDGVGLENAGGDGTAGSHWERSELGDEAMTGADINEPKYSLFTIALLYDSGWYKANLNMVDEITWGYGQGCDFVYKKCRASK